ncbi:MAG: GntR family transcriptional regulator [Caulobacter sp.]|nr:GntR family transcriptional regulator [Caulobacter sp.]
MNEPLRVQTREQLKAERIYDVLRRRIRDLELKPGAPLRKEELALAFGVSRAPVSEALARLAEEGLVDIFPQHGSFVGKIRPEDVREGLFIRLGLETQAMRDVALARDPALLARLDANIAAQAETLRRDELSQFYELDEALHALIFGAVGHPRAFRFLESARAQLDRVRRLALPGGGRPEATFDEHRRLVEAIRMGDGEFAAAAMRAHLLAVAASVERQLSHLAAPGRD